MTEDIKKPAKQDITPPVGVATNMLPLAIVAKHGPYFAQLAQGASVTAVVAGGLLSPVLNITQLAIGEKLNNLELKNGAKAGLKGNAYGAVAGAAVVGISCAVVDAGLTTTGIGAVSWANMPACLAAGASMGSAFGGFMGQVLYVASPEPAVPSIPSVPRDQQPSR